MNDKIVKKYFPFKTGLALLAFGVIWIGILFSGGEKISYHTNLEAKETESLDLVLKENGISFYTVAISGYAQQILFVQILDPQNNVIADKKIVTEKAVNYFVFYNEGLYILEITNLSEKSAEILVDFGNARASELRIPSFVAVFGIGFIALSAYMKLRNQNTAQPEENNS